MTAAEAMRQIVLPALGIVVLCCGISAWADWLCRKLRKPQPSRGPFNAQPPARRALSEWLDKTPANENRGA